MSPSLWRERFHSWLAFFILIEWQSIDVVSLEAFTAHFKETIKLD
jgi:hypothetical protein